jgi:DNA modification methylase
MHNFIETPICMGHERVKNPKHPTQKPVRVLEHLLKLGSKEGDLIFDPFMGVGSTGVAALKMQRRFLGFEKETEYVMAAVPRLEAASGRKAILLPQMQATRAAELELVESAVVPSHELGVAA